VSSRQILDAAEVRRALVRIGHEIVEKHGGTDGLALVGIERRGAPLALRIGDAIAASTGVRIPVGTLDVTIYRDDRRERGGRISGSGGRISGSGGRSAHVAHPLPFDIAGHTVVLVDDVLSTGRTVRAAMDALVAQGRPAAIRLAVLVDRGHRELPIRADHVGKNVPTAQDGWIDVRTADPDGLPDEVILRRREGATQAPG